MALLAQAEGTKATYDWQQGTKPGCEQPTAAALLDKLLKENQNTNSKQTNWPRVMALLREWLENPPTQQQAKNKQCAPPLSRPVFLSCCASMTTEHASFCRSNIRRSKPTKRLKVGDPPGGGGDEGRTT